MSRLSPKLALPAIFAASVLTAQAPSRSEAPETRAPGAARAACDAAYKPNVGQAGKDVI